MTAAYGHDLDPGVFPMDPADLDTIPPPDVDVCEHCNGDGVVVLYIEADTGLPVDEDCSWCGGTGERRRRAVA